MPQDNMRASAFVYICARACLFRHGVIEQQFVASRMVMATRLWQGLLQQHAPPAGASAADGAPAAPSQPSTLPPAARAAGLATTSSWPPPQGHLPVWLAQVRALCVALCVAQCVALCVALCG